MGATRVAVVGAMGIGLAACGRIGFDTELTSDTADQARASIAVGQDTACAIRDGDVYCWGHGEEGQLGTGGPGVALLPRAVVGIPKAIKVAAAIYHTCILSVDGEVWCFGGNDYGRIGVMPPQTFVAVAGGPRTDPVEVPLSARAIDISVSNNSSCAVLETGRVACWGRNNVGQLGRGTVSGEGDANPPALVMDLSDARRVSLDDDSACALRVGGTVVCWGENSRGLIDEGQVMQTFPKTVTGFANATALALGGNHVCAVMGGRVGCRGANDYGDLGAGPPHNDTTEVLYSTLDDAVEIEAAITHTCAVRANGVAECWGNNDFYTLGDGTFEDRDVPTAVVGMDDAIAIATADRATCALRESGAMTCWGYGARGLVGDGRSAETRARMVMTLPNVAHVAVGADHTCVSDTTDVACWGSNRKGQLGTGGSREPTATPQVLPFNWPFGIAQLVAGDRFTCARLANNDVWCWGENFAGQLGIGTDVDQMTPVQVALPPTAALVAGQNFACALGTDRVVRCWGHNAYGQLGNGTIVNQPTPMMIVTNVDAIAAGDVHVCTLSATAVTCWGLNSSGQVGDGTQDMRNTPTAVQAGTLSATSILAGGETTCAQRSAGGIACWGLNGSNVLLATSAPYYQLTPIDSTQTQLFAIGGTTGCVGDTCWGSNWVGQVGAGDLGYYGEPTRVMDLPQPATTFAVSHSHTCAIVSGVPYCWGENASGEIGAGTRSTATFAATTVAFP